MAVTYGTQLTILPSADLMLPTMAAQPLQTAIENANALYRCHQPPLVSVAPMMDPAHARAISFTVGIVPSQDGLRYRVQHLILPAYNGNLTVQVETGRGDPTAWTVVYGPAAAAMVNGVWSTVTHYIVVASNEDRLRFSYTAPGGVFLVSHVLVWPDPDPAAPPLVAPYTRQPSGFWPGDDALIGLAGGPIHTEALDRCMRNSVAVLRDRWQAVASIVQDDGQFGASRHVAPFGTVQTGAWALIGKCRALLPYQNGAAIGGVDLRPTLQVMAQGRVSAGTTADRMRVVVRGKTKDDTLLLAADGTMRTGSVVAEVDGSADAGVDVEFYARAAVGQTVSVGSIALLWRPGG